MLWPKLVLQSPSDSWMWWAYQESLGKAYAGKKYQRERWHLRALHNKDILDSAALELGTRLSQMHGRADVRLGSIWVDHTPQVKAKYIPLPVAKSSRVKCELADLAIVTMASFGGRPVAPGDVRAVLVQAKVTSQPGSLDSAAPGTSSSKERNLLERCSSKLEVWTGTGTSTKLGDFDLGCSPPDLGLGKYSQYLTIPRVIVPPPASVHPYQSIWPTSRASQIGTALSLGEALFDMLNVPASTIGYPLTGPSVAADWQKLIRRLTALYDKEVVNRFTKKGAAAFPRTQQSSLHSCFMSREPGSQYLSLEANSLLWEDMSSAFGDGAGGDGGRGKISHAENDAPGPQIPILLIQANIGHPDYIRPSENESPRGSG